MADYPAAVYAPRTKENKPGIVYNAAKTTIGYAEDITKLDDEVVAIETELGLNPKGSSADLAERLKGLRSLVDADADVIVIKGGNVGIGAAVPATKLEVAGAITAESLLLSVNGAIGTSELASMIVFGGAPLPIPTLLFYPLCFFQTDIHIATKLIHLGDLNTYLQYQPDIAQFVVGGYHFIRMKGTVQREVIVNEEGIDIDFRVESANNANMLFVDASADRVGIGATPDTKLRVAGAIASATLIFAVEGPTDDLDVSGVNTIFIDANSNDVTIGGLVGGVDGQILRIVRCCASAFDVTLEHAEGGGNQDILLHRGADETLFTEYGGWILVCNGVDWFDASHAKHV